MVEVVNTTPEPLEYKPEEGESGEWIGNRWHKHYTLRTDPAMQTAHAAVAWTFGMTPDEYCPLIES